MSSVIEIKYFAVLKEYSGKTSEQVALSNNESAETLYRKLQVQYRFPLATAELRVAINDEFASMDTLLHANDKVIFIPPVAGG